MCGINGIYDLKRKFQEEQLYNLVHEMDEKIIYRGPNHEGIFHEDNLAMGMRRLAILDLQAGNQPIYNEDKSVVIVYNGEIYNFRQLREDLKGKHKFYTETDTEVIVHAYEEYGMDVFDKLDGMFAIALYDRRVNQLILARDRMGEKPLYYYKNKETFLWGSELKSIIGTGIPEKVISKCALNQYLQLTYIPAPLTIYENIYKLMPGHCLIIKGDGETEEKAYWKLNPNPKHSKLTYEQAKEKLKTLLEKSVQNRMVSDVPIGAFLSGGIDSGTVVGVMSRLSEQPIETFTMGFKEKEYDERNRAKMVSDLNGTSHHEYVLDYNDILNAMDEILQYVDEPFADSSMLPSYFVSKFASEYVKVVLTGDAGDELFLGYSKYLIDYYSKKYRKVPRIVRRIFEKIVRDIPDKSAATRKIRKVIDNANKDIFEQRLALMSLGFKEDERKQLLKNNYFDSESMDFVKQIYSELNDESEWKKTQYLDLKVVLEGDMLAKVDRMSMLNSIETRTPLLSRDIIEFAFQLPDEYKIKKKKLKRIMKDAFADILPSNFDRMKKAGFAIPLDYWFRNQLKGEVQQLLNQDFLEKQGLFDYNYIEKILEEHFSGKRNRKSEIWTLFVFQKWYQQYFG